MPIGNTNILKQINVSEFIKKNSVSFVIWEFGRVANRNEGKLSF
jgi:hypothetical protein